MHCENILSLCVCSALNLKKQRCFDEVLEQRGAYRLRREKFAADRIGINREAGDELWNKQTDVCSVQEQLDYYGFFFAIVKIYGV